MDAIDGDPRANAHYTELHKEDVARREIPCFLRKNAAAPCARGFYV